jgi:hypothetical protein
MTNRIDTWLKRPLGAAVGMLAMLSVVRCGSDAEDDRGGGGSEDRDIPDLTFGEVETSSGAAGAAGASGLVQFEQCAGVSAAAEGMGLDIYMIFDHTASMGDDCPLDLSSAPPEDSAKWCFATHALAQYFTSDLAAGHRIALQFMSVEDFVCAGGPDNGEAHAVVDLTPMPVDADHELVRALEQDAPLGGLGTRIEAALHGIATYTEANHTAGRNMIGILITDGDPNGCSEDIDELAQIAADHLEATGIRTFFIGMTGATLSNLETMAVAGGAPEHSGEFCGEGVDTCHYWTVGDGAPDAFVAALGEIQEAATLPCEYAIPLPPPDEVLDYNLVNVTFHDPELGGGLIFHVQEESDCDSEQAAWYYDNPMSPSAILLCEATCDYIMAAGAGARLDVAYGCQTVVLPE